MCSPNSSYIKKPRTIRLKMSNKLTFQTAPQLSSSFSSQIIPDLLLSHSYMWPQCILTHCWFLIHVTRFLIPKTMDLIPESLATAGIFGISKTSLVMEEPFALDTVSQDITFSLKSHFYFQISVTKKLQNQRGFNHNNKSCNSQLMFAEDWMSVSVKKCVQRVLILKTTKFWFPWRCSIKISFFIIHQQYTHLRSMAL